MRHPGCGSDVLSVLFRAADTIQEAGWEIVYPAEPRPDQRRLMGKLGVAVVVDPDEPPGVRRQRYPPPVPPRTQGGHA